MFLITRDIECSLKVEKTLQYFGLSSFIEPLLTTEIFSYRPMMSEMESFLLKNEDCMMITDHNIKSIILIITSKNAVKALFSAKIADEKVSDYDFLYKFLSKLQKVFIVGDSSKDLFCEFLYSFNLSVNFMINHINNNIETFFTSDELFTYITNKVHKSSKMIYLSGEDIRRDIDTELTQKGYNIKRIVVYRMVAAKSFSTILVKKIKNNEISYILLYSVRTAEIFLKLVKKHDVYKNITKLVFFVLSINIANVLKFDNVFFPVIPTNDALIMYIMKHLGINVSGF